jgi:Tol biopolymer transport system component
MHRIPYLLACLLILAPEAFGQGFNAFSGRNHPELRWLVAETEHFRIMYPDRLAGIEVEAAAIAEETYTALSQNLGVSFDRRIRIYLSDEDEIVNGFAVPIGEGYTNIWVHVNEVADVWTGQAKWLRTVLAHELAHIFHFRAVGSPLGLLANLFATPMPRFWTEGLAQYQTEFWDANRGDRWLRMAALEGQLNYNDGRSMWNGRLLYASGNSQLRFFAEQYGDSTLAAMLAHRRPTLFGLAQVHDFNTAFRATIDVPYREFYERWRRHVSTYYFTMASQMETIDSLAVPPMNIPGQYIFDARYSPDTTRIAVLSLPSLQRPITRLHVMDTASRRSSVVAEGSIRTPVTWRPDGQALVFARTSRGRFGSLLNDLFIVGSDGRNTRRLTHSRRASAPAFAPDGSSIAFVGSEAGTGNVFLLDPQTGEETRLTRFEGDVQIASLTWAPTGDVIAFSIFDRDGRRQLAVVDIASGDVRTLTDGLQDDRRPLWSPDGRHIAFTSMRDRVPNVFRMDLDSGEEQRVTHVSTGAFAHHWLPPDTTRPQGSLVIISNVSRARDRAYRINAMRTIDAEIPALPEAYERWIYHEPPHPIPLHIPPDPTLIQERYTYNSWRNITHVATLALPYYAGARNFGLFGMTSFVEPLGKHAIAAVGGVSFADPSGQSFLLASYTNNQWYPSISVSGYRFPGTARFYGNDLLVERLTGTDVTAILPLDLTFRPFHASSVAARLRHVDVEPIAFDLVSSTSPQLPPAEAGRQTDLQVTFTHRLQRPYRDIIIHPLDGFGVRAGVLAGHRTQTDQPYFVRGDIATYTILPGLGLQRLYLFGRARAQLGETLPQDFIGLSRYDDLQIAVPGMIPFTLEETDRVRGYRQYSLGNRVLFGTAEYRVPLLSDLQTRLLGLVSLGATSAAVFVDAGMVWNDADLADADRRLGVGFELKNALNLGFLRVMHAVGIAQPADAIGGDQPYDLYYRIRAAVPF